MRNVKFILICLMVSLNLLYAQNTEVKGVVISADDGEPVIGASVFIKGTTTGTVTNLDGEFSLQVPAGTEKLTISYIGMVTQEVAVQPNITVRLQSDTHTLGDVVVQAGILQRDRVTFTGAYTMVSGEELKQVGNQNLIQSLKSLDPAFTVLENSLAGSDPNTLANIEVRGQTSSIINNIEEEGRVTTDANQPLFILNGFETTLARITDLDINRIESITILKDAGSTAIYGAKAANGVIVVETIKPKFGQIKVDYINDSTVSWADLNSYNMMNSAEKLEYELRAGKYNYPGQVTTPELQEWDLLRSIAYNEYRTRVLEGVDTYWLKEPIRTAFTTRNSIRVSGGSEQLYFTTGASYKSQNGVMKDDYRKTWEGYLDLTYRKDNLNIINSLTVSGTDLKRSSYGSFSNWVNANPYFTMRNAEGEVEKYLERKRNEDTVGNTGTISLIDNDTYNPLYNALLESESKGRIFSVVNNTQLNWFIKPELWFKAALSLSKTDTENTTFIDSRDTQFENKAYTEKGLYTNVHTSGWSVDGNINLSYGKVVNDLHSINFTGRGEIGTDSYEMKGFRAVGLPSGSHGLPSYANSYPENSRPTYYLDKFRKANLLGAFNYAYDLRYLFDVTYRLDGSTTFGSNKKFNSFWSVGLGWNIYKEHFLEDVNWINDLKLRASYGTNGNQNVGTMYSSSIFRYYNGQTVFGQGAYLGTIGNPDLKWQHTDQVNLGLDLDFARRFTLKVDIYRKKTNDLALYLPEPPSAGTSTGYPTNLGYLSTKGLEFTASVSPIYNPQKRMFWTIRGFGLITRSKYGGFDQRLEELNIVEDINSTTSLDMYRDGESSTALYAVRSLGIDPATGNEVYLTKNGEMTFDYDPDDRVKVGDKRPTMNGIISTSFTYQRFMVNVLLRYSFGGKQFNDALFNKVENISRSNISYNQDKRALYDRWQQPGDVAQFRRIDDLSTKTRPSSRFIQKNNYIAGESINLSWDFSDYSWLRNSFIEGLRFNAYLTDIFRLSTIKAERSIDYPFARSVSFGLSVSL